MFQWKLFYIAATAGKFVYIHDYRSKEGDTAKLESEHITATENQCFAFWYFTTNSRDSVYVLQNEIEMLQISDYDHDKWHHVQIPLKAKSHHPYKLAFKVTRGNYGSFGAIFIDDILIDNQKCNCKYRHMFLIYFYFCMFTCMFLKKNHTAL